MRWRKDTYEEVMKFCEDRGLIEKLKESFRTSEYEHFEQENIKDSGLDILDAVHCLYDTRRTNFFIEELSKKIKPGDIILEAGIGTGILSFYAASFGAKVYGCEINADIFRLAEEIRRVLEKKGLVVVGSVEFFLSDATTFVPPASVDVIVSENIYTGMFFESQVKIVSHLGKYLKKGGALIPEKMLSYATLCHIDAATVQSLEGGRLLIPSKERGIEIEPLLLSNPHQYDYLDFKNISVLEVNAIIDIPIIQSGEINSLQMYSDVFLPSGTIIKKEDTTFFNNEIYFMLDETISATKGDTVTLAISYPYGGKPIDAAVTVHKK